ncbi:MAG: molybdenum ABC transporter ATP-binding protein [Ectothiorhodospiraceae bacterium]|nr:molybdenum ABC transporter ATP-binding protein [Ectothiorhodospiraceae bacterium]
MSGPSSIEVRLTGALGTFALAAEFEAPATGIVALVGPSGCGKTTILRCVAGLLRLHGSLRVRGEVWQDDARGIFLPPHARPIGYVFQEPSLFPHLSVRGNLEFGLRRVPSAERRLRLEDVADLLGVSGFLDRDPASLSGGQRQRVAIARALLASPRLLLMDEPLASLDRASKREILPYLEHLRATLDIPTLYVSHSPDEVARLADHLVSIGAGSVRASGPIAEMLTRMDLAREQGADAEAVVDATVTGHDAEFELTALAFSGGTFLVTRTAHPIGQRVRLRVLARDASLTLEHQTGTSILNIFPAVVDEVVTDGASQTVRLDVGGTPLLARITRKSGATLGIEPGRPVHVQVKAVALVD